MDSRIQNMILYEFLFMVYLLFYNIVQMEKKKLKQLVKLFTIQILILLSTLYFK